MQQSDLPWMRWPAGIGCATRLHCPLIHDAGAIRSAMIAEGRSVLIIWYEPEPCQMRHSSDADDKVARPRDGFGGMRRSLSLQSRVKA